VALRGRPIDGWGIIMLTYNGVGTGPPLYSSPSSSSIHRHLPLRSMDAPQRVSDASPLTFGILGNGKCTRDKGGCARAIVLRTDHSD
jgi:hypothetical protein